MNKPTKLILPVMKLNDDAILPTYGSQDAACFDLYSSENCFIEAKSNPNDSVGTGLVFEVPEGWQMLIFPRSGIAGRNHVGLSNCVGVIDSDYRGEVRVLLSAHFEGELEIRKGDRIAQAQLMPVNTVEFNLVDKVSDTERGTGGFGSTGV